MAECSPCLLVVGLRGLHNPVSTHSVGRNSGYTRVSAVCCVCAGGPMQVRPPAAPSPMGASPGHDGPAGGDRGGGHQHSGPHPGTPSAQSSHSGMNSAGGIRSLPGSGRKDRKERERVPAAARDRDSREAATLAAATAAAAAAVNGSAVSSGSLDALSVGNGSNGGKSVPATPPGVGLAAGGAAAGTGRVSHSGTSRLSNSGDSEAATPVIAAAPAEAGSSE